MMGTVSNTCCDSWFYRNDMPLLHEGDMSPDVPNLIGSLSSAEIDQNDSGNWVAQIAQNPSTFNQDIILLNGTTVLAAEGQTLAGIPGGFPLDGIGSTTGVFLGNNGNVVFHSTWDIPDTTVDGGIFLNQTLFVHEGVSTVAGDLITRILTSDNTIDVSDEGNLMVVELELASGLAGAYLYDLNSDIGMNYCTPNVNSTGVAGAISAAGSDVAAQNNVTLTASNLPAGQFGIFVVGDATDTLVVNEGILCVGGNIGRYQAPGEILQVDAFGSFSLSIDLTMIPQPSSFTSATTGDTFYFQAWHRDFDMMGGNTSNFTDGLQVDFL